MLTLAQRLLLGLSALPGGLLFGEASEPNSFTCIEIGDATDSVGVQVVRAAQISEQLAASDQAAAAGTSLADTGDAQDSGTVHAGFAVGAIETGDAQVTSDSTAVFAVGAAEAGDAAEASFVFATFTTATQEQLAATDSLSGEVVQAQTQPAAPPTPIIGAVGGTLPPLRRRKTPRLLRVVVRFADHEDRLEIPPATGRVRAVVTAIHAAPEPPRPQVTAQYRPSVPSPLRVHASGWAAPTA